MASKQETENRIQFLEESMMQSVRGLRNDMNNLTELLAKVRNDLDRVRSDVERVKLTVDTIKNLTANYDVKTDSW